MASIKPTLQRLSKRFYHSFKKKRGWKDFKIFCKFCGVYMRQCLDAFYHYIDTKSDLENDTYARLKTTAKGLHQLLSPPQEASPYSFSILLPIKAFHNLTTEKELRSILEQTSPHFELLLSLAPAIEPLISPLLVTLEKEYPHKIRILKEMPASADSCISAKAYNQLAQEAKNHFLLIMGDGDRLRPDALLRFEQVLRLLPDPKKVVLKAQELPISHDGSLNASSAPPEKDPPFPYCFTPIFQNHFVLATSLWKEIGGLRPLELVAAFYDFFLRTSQANAKVESLPIPLYYTKEKSPPCAFDAVQGIQALKDHCHRHQLDWEISVGPFSSYRIIPRLDSTPKVHAIIPFKDQKDLTLKAVQSVLHQKGAEAVVTAVDNQSRDPSIGDTLRSWGVEVLSISDPFNYSRLNNLAVKQSRYGKNHDLILFMNNDVEIDADSLLEMCRWIRQPKVGMVGCRLFYPDKKIQHGGIRLSTIHPKNEMVWMHTDLGKKLDEAEQSHHIHVCDGVTTACALITRQLFLEVGGFDETWYPIAYSDTCLATKIYLKGLYCLYTPYASGIHYESQTRQHFNIEDFERSTWLHERYLHYLAKEKKFNKQTR